jgi:two-component system, OmpR family, response regulator
LQARLSAMLRRSQLPAFDGSRATEGLRVHASEPRAWVSLGGAEQELDLTQREWSLLTLLVINTGRVVSREEVLARWAYDDSNAAPKPESNAESNVENNALEVYIHRLRKKLEGSRLSIRNVRGLGYLLDQQ